MTKETDEEYLTKARKGGAIGGFLTGLLMATVLYVFTALALIALGLWPGVVWVWFAIFLLRNLAKAFIRLRFVLLTGELPESWLTWREQSKRIHEVMAERKAAAATV